VPGQSEKIKEECKDSGYSMPELVLKFLLPIKAVSTVIPGLRNRNKGIFEADGVLFMY